jgi:hypothetical protein
VLALVAILAFVVGCGRERPQQRVGLPGEPTLGLACSDLVYPCKKLGLVVWLRRPVQSVTATLDGRSVRLATRAGRGAYRHGFFWQGLVADDRAEQYCDHYPQRLAVHIEASALNGDELVASSRPIVSCGYG